MKNNESQLYCKISKTKKAIKYLSKASKIKKADKETLMQCYAKILDQYERELELLRSEVRDAEIVSPAG